VKSDSTLYANCMAVAAVIDEIEDRSRAMIHEWAPGHAIADVLVFATIEALKPTA